MIKHLLKEQILIAKDFAENAQQYYINVRLDGYSEPSLFSIAQQLRYWFYENLSMGTPFKTADEVKDALYLLLYQEIVQFMQFYCRTCTYKLRATIVFRTFATDF